MLEDIKNALPLEEVKSKNTNQSSNQNEANPRPLTPIESKA